MVYVLHSCCITRSSCRLNNCCYSEEVLSTNGKLRYLPQLSMGHENISDFIGDKITATANSSGACCLYS